MGKARFTSILKIRCIFWAAYSCLKFRLYIPEKPKIWAKLRLIIAHEAITRLKSTKVALQNFDPSLN